MFNLATVAKKMDRSVHVLLHLFQYHFERTLKALAIYDEKQHYYVIIPVCMKDKEKGQNQPVDYTEVSLHQNTVPNTRHDSNPK